MHNLWKIAKSDIRIDIFFVIPVRHFSLFYSVQITDEHTIMLDLYVYLIVINNKFTNIPVYFEC